jgi:hypothetical protein
LHFVVDDVAFVWVCPDVFEWHPTNYIYMPRPILAKIKVKLSLRVFLCINK